MDQECVSEMEKSYQKAGEKRFKGEIEKGIEWGKESLNLTKSK